jgi:exportin-1
VVWILKTNLRVASSLGDGFSVQMERIYLEMLHVYKMYSTFISLKVSEGGEQMTKTALIRSMRAVKKATLRLIQTFIANARTSDLPSSRWCEYSCGVHLRSLPLCARKAHEPFFLTLHTAVLENYLPALLDPVLDDYGRNVPDARDAEVLLLFTEVVTKLAPTHMTQLQPHVTRIFESVFQCTLEMITQNFEDYPDTRTNFFKLIRAINNKAFPSIMALNEGQFKSVIDSAVWALKHLERNIADSGLNIVLEVLNNIKQSDVANDFYKAYFLSLLTDVLGVLTDTFHKPGFRLQSEILALLFNIVESGAVTVPLWSPQEGSFANNHSYVQQYVTNLFATSFANLSATQVRDFIGGLFEYNTNLQQFKTHLKDFLVQQKEFAVDGVDNADLYIEQREQQAAAAAAERAAVAAATPGLAYTAPVTAIDRAENDQITTE